MKRKEDELKHKARRYSIQEGIFASAKEAFGTNYVSPFAIAINMSNSLVAMLSSVAGIFGPISQMFGSRLIEKHSRKKVLRKKVFLEALMWIPLIIIAILFYKGIITNILPVFLIFFFSLYVMLANMGYPAWFSWMGDIIDEKYRGRWFSKRNLLSGFVSLVLAISASFFLDYFKKNDWTMFGFIILFSLALIARLISWRILKKQYEPKIKLKKGYHFSFMEFLIKAPKNNFGRFAIFRACFAFSTSISSAVVAIYLLRTLQLSYSYYMIILFSATVFSLIVMELWGKIADKYGNYFVLVITTILIPLIPIAWILSTSLFYLIIVPGVIRGVSWAGFNLASGNFIYDNVSKQKRGLAISYFNVLMGIGVFLGAGLGALLIKFLNTKTIEPIIMIFLIGTIVRMIVVFWWVPKFREIKKIKKFDGFRSLKNLVLKEAKPTINEEIHQLISIKKYINTK